MPRRYLFGPVKADFASEQLAAPCQAGVCIPFDASGSAGVRIEPAATWDEVCARLPKDGQPDFIVLWLSYASVPRCLWSAPVPVVALAPDWNLLFHHYRRCLHRADLVLTDTAGVETLTRAGMNHVRAVNLFGCGHSWLEGPTPEPARDIDVLFIGNFDAAVQRERLPWLARLARLSERWRVLIHTDVWGDAYRTLLRRARIVFNRSIRGECNCRVFEAAAAGALLFQEAGNREVPAYFQAEQEYVAYTEDNLDELLEHYLDHEDERATIAAASHARVTGYSFEALWQETLARIESAWPLLNERTSQRLATSGAEELLGRTWEALSGSSLADTTLVSDLATALTQRPHEAALHNALGLILALQGQQNAPEAQAQAVAGYFQRALACDPNHVVAGLNLAGALAASGQHAQAIAQAQGTLAALERHKILAAEVLDAGHFPVTYDHFRVCWEQAAWAHAGDAASEAQAKRVLLRWRLHALLAQLTGELHHHYEAVLARPDLPPSRAFLGVALLRAGRPAEAASQLRAAVAANPFDVEAARLLFEALGTAGDEMGQRHLAHERRLLAQAAPKVVPLERWFVETPPPGDELASLIILCCNELDYTRQCLESVLQHTRPPYELIVVDNGSTDGTPQYLEEVRHRAGPFKVRLVRNEENRGFAAGVNQGLAQARGRYLVLLNNDTLVTPGWLEGLIRWALKDWPQLGMVGPVTSYAAPPQQVAVDYRTPQELEAFAARRRREYAGQALGVERLLGFCLLVRRDVIEAVGGRLDEGFGLGFFEDDDLCVRALQKGYRLAVALDVFVHHYGSRTFAGLGIDCYQQLQDNLARFRAKWGAERAAGYHLPARSAPPPEDIGATPATDAAAVQRPQR